MCVALLLDQADDVWKWYSGQSHGDGGGLSDSRQLLRHVCQTYLHKLVRYTHGPKVAET